MDLSHFYSADVPEFFEELCACPELQRLRRVGMNCGCEYTQFSNFRHIGAYSRYDHSVGVGRIVWNFTHDPVQTAAGLLHDVSTPVFAHVIDFLHGDHMTQEYTENRTERMILSSEEICRIFERCGISPEATTDYHLYPVADNDSPKLSADRLEYTLGNMVNYGFTDENAVRRIYTDLIADCNEFGETELMFRTKKIAREFAGYAIRCSEVYVCDEDRYSMQMLAELIRDAIDAGLFQEDDLYRTEPEIIELLCADPNFRQRWERYCSYTTIIYNSSAEDSMRRKIRAKKRYIDPFVQNEGRVSALCADYHDQLSEFLSRSQDFYLSGK